MSDITTLKYNLIKAKTAQKLANNKHKEYLYTEYMKNLNKKIVEAAEIEGSYNTFFELPPEEINERIIQEIKEAGYIVKYTLLNCLEISWSKS